MRITQGNADYKIDKIPAVDAGQVYVVLSKSATLADDANRFTGPAILQGYPKGKAPSGHPPPLLFVGYQV
ncbi:hypothetical protein MMC16_002975 [Acarospora aff. strigata]|nr:hypothetical protein [Acarospora aff. strigata]